jgi:hypothetical protein
VLQPDLLDLVLREATLSCGCRVSLCALSCTAVSCACSDPRDRLEGAAQTVRALSQARPHRQAGQCRHRRDRREPVGFIWAIARRVPPAAG